MAATLGDSGSFTSDGRGAYSSDDRRGDVRLVNVVDGSASDEFILVPGKRRSVIFHHSDPYFDVACGEGAVMRFTSASVPDWYEATSRVGDSVVGDVEVVCPDEYGGVYRVDYPGSPEAPEGECITLTRTDASTLMISPPRPPDSTPQQQVLDMLFEPPPEATCFAPASYTHADGTTVVRHDQAGWFTLAMQVAAPAG